MRIGLYLKWHMGSLQSAEGNVLGDELYAESLCRALKRQKAILDAQVYAPNNMPREQLDVMVYLNDAPPLPQAAHRHVLFLQNGYEDETAEALLARLYAMDYDGYIFFSRKLLQKHERAGRSGIFLPFGVDCEMFHPMPHDPGLAFEVSYVGNDIKGTERTLRYLYPATAFHFGLFGNWRIPDRRRLPLWRRLFSRRRRRLSYKYKFEKLSRGRIPQEQVPVLYSSSLINLNCTLQSCVDWDVITLRTYEVLACKGFLITDKVRALEAELTGGVVFTDGGKDLTEKIRYYLTHSEERAAIAERGYNFVTANASVEARARELLRYCTEVNATKKRAP